MIVDCPFPHAPSHLDNVRRVYWATKYATSCSLSCGPTSHASSQQTKRVWPYEPSNSLRNRCPFPPSNATQRTQKSPNGPWRTAAVKNTRQTSINHTVPAQVACDACWQPARRIVPPRPGAGTLGNPETFWWGFLTNIFLCTWVASHLSMHRFRSLPQRRWPYKPCQNIYYWLYLLTWVPAYEFFQLFYPVLLSLAKFAKFLILFTWEICSNDKIHIKVDGQCSYNQIVGVLGVDWELISIHIYLRQRRFICIILPQTCTNVASE